MCTAGIDCRFCKIIETCPRVRAAFPTREEDRTRPPARKVCATPGCKERHKEHSKYCVRPAREQQREMRRAGR